MEPESRRHDSDVQIAESSPVTDHKVVSSSPLKTDADTAALLRDRFVYRPGETDQNGSREPKAENAGFGTKVDNELSQLMQDFPDFSETLIKAVFKSNSFDISLARERLAKIHAQKNSRSWAWNPGERKPTNRLVSLGATNNGSNGQINNFGNAGSQIISSPEKSSKITLEKQKTSIFDRYSHVMNQRARPMMESVVIDPSTISQQAPRKRRRLVRAEDTVKTAGKKSSVSLSDEEEEEVSGEEDVSGDEYHERTPEVNIDEEILKFINEADVKDIADIADTTLDKANVLISCRPFADLHSFGQMDFPTSEELDKQREKKKATRRGQQKKDGEKLLDKMVQTTRGYYAIDSVIKRCSSYGKLIANQMQKWGIDMEDIQNGELNFIDVDVEDGYDDDAPDADEQKKSANGSEEVTTSKKFTADQDSEDEEDEEELYQESEDEDYGARRKLRYTSGLRRGRPKQKSVKFFKRKPELLSSEMTLKDYQQTGINWLNLLYQNHMSCILADEMGLGKTCQVIAFLAYLKQIKEPGPHLVVVPSSTLENWLREFNKFCPEMKIEPYYGSQQERAELRDILEDNDGHYDVIVTTYNLASGNKYDVSFLKNRGFNVVVYDEGHMLKNSMTERFAKLMKIEANFRLLLTGTPLQNNLKELMSLLEFIMPSLFVSKKDDLSAVFRQRARTSDSNKDYNPLLAQEAIGRAKTMMKPFILRRRKDQVLKHLPPKHSRVQYCDMTKSQREIYDKEIKQVMEHKQSLAQEAEEDATGKDAKKTHSRRAKNLIMALRKASLHPLLFRNLYKEDILKAMSYAILKEPEYSQNGNQEYIMEDMSYMNDFELHKLCLKFPKTLSKFQLQHDEWMESGKITVLSQLLKDITEKKKEKVLVFSLFTQVLDILELVLTTLNINFLRLDGSTQVNDRQALIDKFYEDEDVPVFILSTKAGGFGINLVCANNVIIFDQSFNPHDDKQAADRAHRVGQTKPVSITTIITRNSIEEKINQLAKNKLALDTYISGDEKSEEALETKVSDILENIIYDENK
ncbi:LAMI_0F06634g1_1 [Lachancea mirantina]|uniref:DNA helicase n=1 Tax=Lachancea mirantina TaxID=1230905 RepID=A0A1G4JZD8_9SACH|nr:LAMI_0F06634g1_1 [Lachancea mirantina]